MSLSASILLLKNFHFHFQSVLKLKQIVTLVQIGANTKLELSAQTLFVLVFVCVFFSLKLILLLKIFHLDFQSVLKLKQIVTLVQIELSNNIMFFGKVSFCFIQTKIFYLDFCFSISVEIEADCNSGAD